MIDALSHDLDVIYCLWYYWSCRCIYSMCANGIIDDSLTAFLLGVDNLQTTSLGEKRIIRNLRLSPWQDAVSFCREVLFLLIPGYTVPVKTGTENMEILE